jgi:hypothetical protein
MVGFVLLLDVSHVDLAPRHHESDQVAIVRSQTLHALVQSLGEERVFVLDGMHNRQESFLDVTRKLALDRLFEIVAADTFVLLKDQSKLGVVALAEDHVEDGLVGAPDFLSGVVEGLGVSCRFLLIRDHAFVACRAAQRHHQAFEVAAGVPFQVAFKVSVVRCELWNRFGSVLALSRLTLLVRFFDGADFRVGQGAHHLDENVFVGAQTADGIVQFFDVELG